VAALARLRRLCLALPQAEERRTWDCATFRVRARIFAMHVAWAGEAVWCKAPPGVQAMLVEVAPERFFVPPYVGCRGWIGVRLDRATDWRELAELIERSWRMTAPKRLAAGPLSPPAPVGRPAKEPATTRPTSRRSAAPPGAKVGVHRP